MKVTLTSFKIASWTLLIGGIIHTISDLLSPETPEKNEIIAQMKSFTGQVLGNEFNLFGFFQGFSFTMGLLLFGYGALNLLILKNNQDASIPSNVLILNIIITLISVLISIKYFFILPTFLTALPLIGYVISYSTRID